MPSAKPEPECLSVFGEKEACPDDAGLRSALGMRAHTAWKKLVERVGEAWGPSTAEWKFSGARYGWSLRLKQRERIVLYLIPQKGSFLAGVVLGDRAVAAAREAGLPPSILALLDAARRYAEGTGIRVPVAKQTDLAPVEKLVALKMAPAG